MDRNLELNQIVDQEEVALRGSIENEKKISKTLIKFESNLSSSESTPFVDQTQQP